MTCAVAHAQGGETLDKSTRRSAEVKALAVGTGTREDAELESCLPLFGQGEGRLRGGDAGSQAQRHLLVGPDAACRLEPLRPRLYAGSVRPPEATGSTNPG